MKKQLVVLVVFFIFSTLFPTGAWPGSKQIVFFDDFSNNINDWSLDNSEFAVFEIRDGVYYFSHNRNEKSWNTFKTIGIDDDRDFEIETVLKKVDGVTNNGYGLLWGRKDGNNQYEFQVTGDGYFRIKKYVNGVAHDFAGWTKSSAVRTQNGSTNKLKLEKTGYVFNFYVNDIRVHTMRSEPFMGNIVGFLIYDYQKIGVDYLKIAQSRPDDLGPVASSAGKARFFSDEFSNNINAWPLQSSENASLGIQNGFYSFEYLKENGWWNIYKEIPMDSGRDFEIETVIRKTAGIQNNGYGLIWGKQDDNNQFEFQISSNGYYKIKKRAGGELTDIQPWTVTGTVNQGIGAVNRINVVKRNGLLRFYINSVEVYSMKFEPFMGNKFGYLIYQNQGVAIDYLHLSYLDGSVYPRTDKEAYADAGTKYGTVETQRHEPVANSPYIAPAVASSAGRGKSLALVIGNAEYVHGGNLRNPVNDAREIQKVLRGLGFTVDRYDNCTQKAMKRAIDDFGKKLRDHQVGLFFYAGHGVQVNGANYLIPVDARLEASEDVEYDCVRADRVLAKMESAGSRTNIVILDACRDNPFERGWNRSAKSSGLAFMNAPSGSLIAYATSPGATAADGAGENGVYTEALLKHIGSSGISILQMFQKVRSEVMNKTDSKQVPWESTSLRGDFYFK